MVRQLTGLLGAIQFLTRVPVRTRAAVPHERTLPWFPVVGGLIGLIVGGVAVGLAEWFPVGVAAAVAVATGLLITGAFHEDGLADIADAFGGGWTPEQRFEILKDSRHGTYGVAALCGSIVIRVVSAGSIVAQPALLVGFIAAHTLGRTAAIAALMVGRPATRSGLGASAATGTSRFAIGASSIVAAAAITAIAGWWAAPLVAVSIAGAGAVMWLSHRKIGGLTGDTLGAIEQVVECLVLVTVSGLALHHELWWK
ncbi:MAG TPA: adenosylcobinamide-GDP ribazoletransferase [Ilumatobacter sp.]|nr:adenosylcobinamide-GDP ribazoletransferase [Ilumatobacter sp.]